MIRKIIEIDKEKCNGCGLCISACHEAAIQLIDGKAELISESYCDGLGDCLPECPTAAIKMVEREALEYDEETVKRRIAEKNVSHSCNCQSQAAKTIDRAEPKEVKEQSEIQSELRQWPVQIKLVPASAPYFKGADLLIAADCTAYAYGNIQNIMRGKITVIGCPKLDDIDYSEKLTEIIKQNQIESVTVVRMEVPCCGGIVNAVKEALHKSGEVLPFRIITITTDGNLIEK